MLKQGDFCPKLFDDFRLQIVHDAFLKVVALLCFQTVQQIKDQ